MLPLDHLPFRTPDLTKLAAAFEALGFTVSPPGAYTSADVPDARWPNRCVFLKRGWFDLLADPVAEPVTPGPGGCLFRTDDLDATLAGIQGLRTRPAYRLERRWDDDIGLPPETFALFDLRERIAPIPLAVIEHAWPCPDIAPGWMDHPNGAIEITGLVFGGSAPGPAADQASASLDLAGFEYLPAETFAQTFGADVPPVAVRIKVGSLNQASEALQGHGARFTQSSGRLIAYAAGDLDCRFVFFA